jgi:NTP pyrophosphatase (non-canonical NTP hydrolase)
MRQQLSASLWIEFGPLSLVAQEVRENTSIVTLFHYSEDERRHLADWLMDFALLDQGEEDIPPLMMQQADAPWTVSASTYRGIDLTGVNDKRHVSLWMDKIWIGNLGFILINDLAFTPDEYQRLTKTTAQYYELETPALSYLGLGLAGEAGEVTNALKKVYRDHNAIVDDSMQDKLEAELGDVLWYCARLADELGLSLEQVMRSNLLKLQSRQARNLIAGEGDYR